MKFPKRWPNRVRKSLIPDKAITPAPPKTFPTSKKKSSSDWRRRWFLSAVALALASSAVMAQTNTPSTGPVRLPSGFTTNAPVAAPSFAPAVSSPPVAPQTATSADAGDIRDIRGPISIPYEWLWVAYILIGLVVASMLYVTWRFFLGRFKAKEKMPFELALDLLGEAYKQLRDEEITAREYAFLASEIIRLYIEQRFGEKAARRTTEEFLSDLLRQTGTPLAQYRGRLEDFLNYCDLMKFARWEASTRDLESMHESAREFILETRPQPESTKAATPSAQPQLVQAK